MPQLASKVPDNTLRIATPKVFMPLLKPARYKGAHGGRGSGKSYFFADLLIEDALRTHIRGVCIREIQQSLKESVRLLLLDRIEHMGVGQYFDVMEDRIIAPNEGMFIFTGMQNHTAETIKSLQGFNRGWFEEAHKMSAFSFGLLYPTIRADDSELWFSWNPNSPKDPVDKFLRSDDRPASSIVVEANYYDNPFFPEVLREDMERDKRRDPDRYAHVWLGKYRQFSEARVFRNFRIDEFETPEDARFHFGCDWGFSVDPTVLVRCFIIGRKLYVDREVWKVGLEIDHTPAFFAGSDTRVPPRWSNPKGYQGIPGALRWPIRADSANPQAISYMQLRGFTNMQPSIKGTGSVEEGIEFLKSFDIVIHPRCVHVIDEMSSYSYKIDSRTEEILPQLDDRKNHTIDSLRYALEPLRRHRPQATFGVYGTVLR